MADFEVVFQDESLWVVNKSAGLLSQADKSGDVSLVEQLKVLSGTNFVGIVQRLDRNTSGLMVVAKNSRCAEILNAAIKTRDLKRQYFAIAKGAWVGDATQVWSEYLVKDEVKNQVFVCDEATQGSQLAELSVTCTKSMMLGSQALVACQFELKTGRSHQIRVQAAHHGHPLLGDPKYGKGLSVERHYQILRPMLHSQKLEFTHPTTGARLKFDSTLPADIATILNRAQ
jgi:23S rRNA pseudouridine1911/1915/1917 synthase